MALTPISKLARISPLSGNSVFPIVQNGTTYGAEISSVNNLNNCQISPSSLNGLFPLRETLSVWNFKPTSSYIDKFSPEVAKCTSYPS